MVKLNNKVLVAVVAAVIMLAAFAAFLAVYQLPADAAPAGLPPAAWLVKADDAARVAAVGPLPGFQWVSCGGPQEDVLPCSQAGDTPTFTDFYAFRRWVLAGHRGTALIDYEGWVFTPHWQRTHLLRYIRMTGQLAAAHGVKVILAPVSSPNTVPNDMLALDIQAARYGAQVVDIQHQAMTSTPSAYAALVKSWVPQIRAAAPGRVTVIAGIAADPGGRPVTAATLTQAYNAVRPYVDGVWLNAALWTTAKGGIGCAPQGCPLVVLGFLAAIGA